jgi:hypothetical protein
MDIFKIVWILIPIGAYLFFAHGARKERESAKIYFWLFIIAFGLMGFLYSWISTGSIPPPCCTN